jgi:hypothetical protein
MKLQSLALGLALVVAGTASMAATHETTVTRVTPHGTVTKHIVRSNERDMYRHHDVRKVVVMHPQHYRHHVKKVVIVHPAHHGHYAVNRTVVVRHRG